MKRRIFILSLAFIMLFSVNSLSLAEKSYGPNNLEHFSDLIKRIAFGGSVSQMTLSMPKYSPKDTDFILNSFDDYIKDKTEGFDNYLKESKELKEKESVQHYYAIKYTEKIKTLIKEMEFIGQDSMCYFKFSPFEFTTNSEGELGLIYYTGNTVTYNTLQTSAKSRAKITVEENLLSMSNIMYKVLKDTDIDFYITGNFYNTRDFQLDNTLLNEPEVTFLSVTKEVMKSYSNLEISDTELIKKGNIYNKNKSMESDSIRKIDLTI